MDVFSRYGVVNDYADYIGSFINIRDPKIDQYVKEEMRQGLLMAAAVAATESPTSSPARASGNWWWQARCTGNATPSFA